MIKIVRLLTLTLSLTVLLAACLPATGPTSPLATATPPATVTLPPSPPRALEGTQWELISLNGQPPLEGSGALVGFYADSYMEGTSGCNSFGVDYVIHGREFQLAEIHRTQFTCEEPSGIMPHDEAFFEALDKIAAYEATEDRLAFQDDTGATILVYAPKLPPAVDPALQGAEWALTQLRGEELVAGSYIQLTFRPDGFGGFAGCNHYGGEYQAASEGILQFGQAALTAMDCYEPEGVMDQEQAYMEALNQARAYHLDGDRLEIRDGDGEILLVYARQETLAGNPAELPGTAWQLASLDGREPAEGSALTLAFHQGSQTVSGYAGCRDYVATYQADGQGLGFPAMTMMGPVCPEEPRLAQEGEFTTLLGWTARFRIDQGRLELRTVRGETLLFDPLPPEDLPGLEGPVWTLLAFVEPNPQADPSIPAPLTTDALEGTAITAAFEGGVMAGSAGCNQYSGAYQAEGNGLTLGPMGSTKMACLEPEGLMEQESRYLQTLANITAYHLYGRQLWLETADGRALVYTTREATDSTAQDDALAAAQEALSAYEPVTDAQPVVNLLLPSIAGWLDAGGEPPTLETILNETPMEANRGPVTVTELDLTGGPEYRARDVVVRIPAMGLPLLVFVNEDGSPARFAGYALPPDLEAIRTDFPLETTEIDKPALQLEDLTGDGVPEVLFASMFAGASNYRLRPNAFQWHEGDFRLIFAADLVSWAGRSDYALEPDPTGKGSLQIVLTYPHLYSHGFDHKMINHPAGRQVWRWSPDAEKFVLSEEQVDLEQNGWESGAEPGLPVTTEDRLRWLTNEGEAAFRAGRYEEAVPWYEQVLAEAGAEDWQPETDEPDWAAYAAFRRAEALLLLGQGDEGLPAMEAVATDMEGDLLGDLARAFLQGYGSGQDPDAAARGVAAMRGGDLYAHLYYERSGALRFPMDAPGILYPGAGMAAYLNAHPDLAGDLPALRAGLAEIGFHVGGVLADENGDLSIIVPLPNRSYAYGQDSWVLAVDGDRWHVSLPVSEGEWPTLGMFAWATPAPVLATTCMNEEGVVFTVPAGPDGVRYGAEQTGPMALTIAPDGTFWIADTQGNRLLHYDPQGVLLNRIDLNGYGVYGAADVEPAGSDILALCCGRVLRLTAGGDLLAAYDIPDGLGPEGGLTGLAVGDQGEILLEFMMGAEVAQLVGAQGALEPSPLSGYTHDGQLYKAQLAGWQTSQGTIVAGSARIEVMVPNTLAGLRILGFTPAGNLYVVVDEMVSTPSVVVDETVRLYDPAGELLGVARVPLAERYTYVQNGLAVGPDGCVYALLTHPERVEVVRLGFSTQLEPILPTPAR